MKRLFLAALLFLCAAPAFAAVTANSVVTPQTPNRGIAQFLQGTDTAGTYKTLYTGATNGSKCSALWETNNDGSATHLVTVEIVNSAVKYGGVAVTSAVNDGYANAVPAKNLMSATAWPGLPLDSDGNPFFFLASGDTLQATFATALTASTKISLVTVCADF
jgi:hypothetical protein